MNTVIILLAQTRGGAAIEILSLLLVAAIIVYVTAWLFYRSVYEKKLKLVESDKHELSNRIINLDSDVFNLKQIITAKDEEMEQLILSHIAEKKHFLDYQRFGIATPEEKDDLKMISGIGPVIEKRLNAIDIYTLRQISKFTPSDIEAINESIIYFSGRIDRDEWVSQARELVNNEEHRIALFKRISERKPNIHYTRFGLAKEEEADDLTLISGIGGWIQEKLKALDIYTFRQISKFTKEDIDNVTDAIEFFHGRIERDEWVNQAKELVRIAGDKVELFKRIRDRKEKLHPGNFGPTNKIRANNLTRIDGLGIWVEERLNTLDIYTFEQISKLTHADINTVEEVLELIPGRIEKDNWVGQARELAKNNVTA